MCVLDNLILADELFGKALQRIELYLSDSNNLCGKSASSLELPIILDDNLIVIPVSFVVANFNLLGYKFDNLTFTQ